MERVHVRKSEWRFPMKHIAKLSAAMLALASITAYAGESRQLDFPNNSTIGPAEVVDSAGAILGLWFPDIPGDDEYLVHTIGSITFIAEVRNDGIKGNPAAYLYYSASDCSGPPFIKVVFGASFYQDRLTIPFQETFSGFEEETGSGTPPLYYADSTSKYSTMTVCSEENPGEDCEAIPGCESINVYPALTWDWSHYVEPFLFKQDRR
jgi:hypothetical protein